jgi:hypothetical protein
LSALATILNSIGEEEKEEEEEEESLGWNNNIIITYLISLPMHNFGIPVGCCNKENMDCSTTRFCK